MQILRVRRGYTTNSSGGNEWVPPANVQINKAGQTQQRQDGGAEAQAGGSASGKQVTILATELPATSTPGQGTAQAAPAGPRRDNSSANLGIMGALIGAVCLLFAVTGLVKRALRKLSEGNEAGGTNDRRG